MATKRQEQENEEDQKQGLGTLVGWILFLVIWIGFHLIICRHHPLWHIWGFAFAFAFFWLTILLIHRCLALNRWYFILIEEATAAVIVRGGKFIGLKSSCPEGFYQDKNGNIRKILPGETLEKEKRRFERLLGGIHFLGILVERYSRHHRFSALRDNGVREYSEDQDFVFLPIDYYVFSFPISEEQAIEDIKGIGIGVSVVMPARIYNPRTALFATKSWVQSIYALLRPVLEQFVPNFRWKEDLTRMVAGVGIEDLQKQKQEQEEIEAEDQQTQPPEPFEQGAAIITPTGTDLKEEFWKVFKNSLRGNVNVQEIASDNPLGDGVEAIILFGVMIYKKGFTIFKVDPPPDFRQLATKAYVAQKEAEATIITANARAEAEKIKGGGIAKGLQNRTVAFALEALATKYGKKPAEISEDLKNGLYSDEFDLFLDEGRQREGIDQGTFRELRYPKGDALSSFLDRVLSATQKGGEAKKT
ncbi:hypothetical protein COT20_02485 [bacterium (Candidatus Gribaldobacteria) CG08_land_8_20_14_0_20_39_15]|uniref:Band 7 domain-containing protein n=1 Tax=bacterium (Candidatus Gribaldobacteria) CG08_land_8_20_14_0_20_39_15 TaxID=2014273 RepID=A0A2M6XU05_9BACT|nr:MAG: hypothetical protein COT20_02485 [bacterium (Candidatus Gribaldobacteria) CG08_land_8_20_14_0_20_39_15]